MQHPGGTFASRRYMSGNEVVVHGGRLGGAEDISRSWEVSRQHDSRPFDLVTRGSHALFCDALESQHCTGGDHPAAVLLLLTEVTGIRLKLWQRARVRISDEIGATACHRWETSWMACPWC